MMKPTFDERLRHLEKRTAPLTTTDFVALLDHPHNLTVVQRRRCGNLLKRVNSHTLLKISAEILLRICRCQVQRTIAQETALKVVQRMAKEEDKLRRKAKVKR